MMTIIAFAIIALLIFGCAYAYYIEKRDFNNGICRKCGSKLRHFDNDSSGARGYTCDKCYNKVWVSYSIDKNFR